MITEYKIEKQPSFLNTIIEYKINSIIITKYKIKNYLLIYNKYLYEHIIISKLTIIKKNTPTNTRSKTTFPKQLGYATDYFMKLAL